MLDLYILETCPFCRKVMDTFDETNIEYNKKNILEKENIDELIKLGGKQQVPFLVDNDNDKFMYESDDIIEYVKNKV